MAGTDSLTVLLRQYPSDGRVVSWPKAKPDGGVRFIASPDRKLKVWLKTVNRELNRQFSNWPDFMHGGIKGRSYITYAKPHIGKPCVINIDIRNCFGSIKERDVCEALKRQLNIAEPICVELAHKLCYRGKIAQGFPTSNFICNLYLLEPLKQLHSDLKSKKLSLTNYVDDITISGAISSYNEVVNQVALSLSHAKLAMNKKKVSVMPSSKRQTVGGLTVNKKLTLPRTVKLRLMADLASGKMDIASAQGWVANLKDVDPIFARKFYAFATKKGILD